MSGAWSRLAALVMLLSWVAAAGVQTGEPRPHLLEPVAFSNRTGREIVHLFVSPRGAREWGADALGGARRLAAGSDVDFFLHTDGVSSYDILAVDHLGDAYLLWDHPIGTGQSARVEIGAADLEGGYDHPPLATVRVANRSGRDIWYLFVAAGGSALAGVDVLDASTILEDGEEIPVIVPVTGETVTYELTGLDVHDGRFRITVEIAPATRTRTVEVQASDFGPAGR